MTTNDQQGRRKLIPEMEGLTARWYAKQRGSTSQRESYRRQAGSLTEGLPAGSAVLEVAPGPGYLAIEIARLGYPVTGLDVSRTMVEIAAQQGSPVDFRHGDVARMPFADDSFDLIVCQAAFKNFSEPARALDELHRVLRPGGTAVIQDMSRDASNRAIDDEVRGMGLSAPNAWVVRMTLRGLRRRALSPDAFRNLSAQSRFGSADVTTAGIGLEARFRR